MHTTITSARWARLGARAAACAAGLALIGTAPAHALPREESASRGCAVENNNGTISYVDTGTRIGLFVCGSDGGWHFGWLVNP